MENLKNWKSSLVGVIAIIAAILGLIEPNDIPIEIGGIFKIIINALAGMWLIFKSKD